MTTPPFKYEFSKDYEKLYELVCDNHSIFALVDYTSFSLVDKYPPSRDTCSVRKMGNFYIQFISRGMQYGGVCSFHKEDGHTEKEWFIAECERMNVEFLIP